MNINTELLIRRQEVIDLRKHIDKLIEENIKLKNKINNIENAIDMLKFRNVLSNNEYFVEATQLLKYLKEGDGNGNRNI